MKKNKNTPTYQQHLNNMASKKEQLPFHKMDELSRRRFIQSIGYFMAVLTVPTIVRLETMSKISRKLLGNSLAFAATPGAEPIKIALYYRSGYGFVPWIVGAASDNDTVNNPADRNIAWGPDTTTSVVTTGGQPVILPPHSAVLTPYVNGIQAIQSFSSTGGHDSMFRGTAMPGVVELLSATSKSQIDAGLQSLLTQPFGYFNTNDFAVQNVPGTLAQYAPANYSNINTVSGLFTPPTLTTSQGNQLSASLQKSVFAAMGSQFSDDIENAMIEKDKDLFKASHSQALKILSTDYHAALDPAQNGATMTMLTTGLPAQTRMGSNVNPAQAIFQIITAANLGITPRIGMVGFNTGDWHNDNGNFALGNAGAGTTRAQSAAFIATLIKNVFDTVNSGVWTNTATGQNEVVEFICASEFTRTNDTNNQTDDGDGMNNGTLILSSNVNQTSFVPGSFGKVGTSGQTIGFNTSTFAYSSSIGSFTTAQALYHNAQLFGIKPSDFGISGSGIGGNMVK